MKLNAQQRLMDALFGPELEPNVFVYIDDLISVSSTFDEHIKLLSEVKYRLKDANLTINREKCEFFKTFIKIFRICSRSVWFKNKPRKSQCYC